MKTQNRGWNICVVNTVLDSFHDTGLSNALLYADEVVWIPTMLPILKWSKELEEFGRTISDWLGVVGILPRFSFYTDMWTFHGGFDQSLFIEFVHEQLGYHQAIIDQIEYEGLPIVIPQSLKSVPDRSFAEELRARERRGYSTFKSELDNYSKLRRALPIEFATGQSEEVVQHLQRVRACSIAPNSPYSLILPSHWNADRATQSLMDAMSNVLLPDVSSLPFAEVLELGEKVKDELNPMRGELLRLTEDLRTMVKDECSEAEVAREAANLIKTRVESVLFKADRNIKDHLSNRWKEFLTGTLKTIGLVGCGFLWPELFKDAKKSFVETVANTMTDRGQPLPPTAQFVLELRRHFNQRYNY